MKPEKNTSEKLPIHKKCNIFTKKFILRRVDELKANEKGIGEG